MLTFPSPISVCRTSDHRSTRFSLFRLWRVFASFLFFVNKTCFYTNLAKFESFYLQAEARRCSGCRVLALVARGASSRLNFKRNRPPTFCAQRICFWAAFRDDYTMQSLKIICTAWRRADRLQLQHLDCSLCVGLVRCQKECAFVFWSGDVFWRRAAWCKVHFKLSPWVFV